MNNYYVQSLLVVAGWGVTVMVALLLVKLCQLARYDRYRRTYVAYFPADLSYDRVLAFVRALHGLPTPKLWRPIHSVVFDVYGDVNGIKHIVSIPGHVVADVEGLFRTHTGGSLVKLDVDPIAGQWDHAIEIGLTSSHTPLRSNPPDAAVQTILSQFSPLTDDDAVLMQWVLFPAHHHAPQVPEAKEKLAEPNFRAIGRLAGRGKEAQRLVHRLRTGLKAMERHGVNFRQQPAFPKRVHRRLVGRSGVVGAWSTYSAPELAVLLAAPFGSPNVAGLPGGRARYVAPAHVIPATGVVLGRSNYPGMEDRLLAMPPEAFMTHMQVIGNTGVGKSAFLHNIAIQVARAGHGLVVIEPKGDLARDILVSIPEERAQDVIWFDVTDVAFPIGFNVLAGNNPEQTAAHIVATFNAFHPNSWGPRLAQSLHYGTLTAALNNLTLLDVKRLYTNPEFRNSVVRATNDSEVRDFWRSKEDVSEYEHASVINKLDGLLASRAIRNMVGQTGGLDLARVVRDHKILLVPLPEVEIGEANGAMMASLLIGEIWRQVLLRPQAERRPIVTIIDEAPHYMRHGVETMLAEARSYQLGIVAAHQHLGQFPDKKIAKAFKSLARSKVAFRIDAEDGKDLESDFKPLGGADLASLGQFEAAFSVMTAAGNAPTATGRTLPPPRPIRSGRAIIEASRALYARPVREVEAEFQRRHRLAAPERPRPRIGHE